MARPGLFRHRKFIRLARELGSEALAIGHLELIWHAAYESGEANIGKAADVEFLARWTGEPGRLARLLVECGFLEFSASQQMTDACQDGGLANEFASGLPGLAKPFASGLPGLANLANDFASDLLVHDLYDHAPDYVKRRAERERERRKQGKTLSQVRAEAGSKGGVSKAVKQAAGKCQAVANDCQSAGVANGATPTPAPAPAPTPIEEKNPPPTPPAKPGGERGRSRPEFPPIPPELDTLDFRTAWDEWLAHRRERRPQVSPRSAKLAFAELVPLGVQGAVRAIHHSIACGYQGIVPAPSANGPPPRAPPSGKSTADVLRERQAEMGRQRAAQQDESP